MVTLKAKSKYTDEGRQCLLSKLKYSAKFMTFKLPHPKDYKSCCLVKNVDIGDVNVEKSCLHVSEDQRSHDD